ncbi:hypothetical protein [Hoeflea sp.]|uniref:hypothetical protein n=1 Tax=Hoeflea sp. TaxID=1940281 RepID=UPI003B51854C
MHFNPEIAQLSGASEKCAENQLHQLAANFKALGTGELRSSLVFNRNIVRRTRKAQPELS